MSITLDLPDELVEQLKRLSETTGATIEEIVRQGVQAQFVRPTANAGGSERRDIDRLLNYAGCMDSGIPNSGDNSQIDLDLATAYGNRTEAA